MRRMATTQWWRIEFGAEGFVKSCRQVDGPSSDAGSGVSYVQALTEAQACRSAGGKFASPVCPKQKRAREKPKSLARPAMKVVPEPRPPTVQPIPAPPVVKPTPPANIGTRLALLVEVQEAWLDNPRVGQFSQWLSSQIETLRGKRSA